MLATHVPHALLLAGPPSVGKQALAADLAAALLCTGAGGADRPCRACRGCRMVEHDNHPDLHRLQPEGPGGQVGIGGPGRPRGVRDLVVELALLPVEGGGRVAVVHDAHRMNEDAQSALLKTLEEPPGDTTLILIADDEERLLPTIRSRCARVRLGTVGMRDVEQLLAARELADPPTAARVARLVGGRSGLAVAYAAAPEAVTIRGEITRTLLDLLGRGRAARLVAGRDLMGRGATLAGLLSPPAAPAETRRGRGRGPASPASIAADPGPGTPEATVAEPESDAQADAAGGDRKASAADRRRALGVVLDAWLELARDLALAEQGAARSIRDVALLDELVAVAGRMRPGAAAMAAETLVRARELLDANVSPELLLDVALLRWPRVEPSPEPTPVAGA
jgi:DNA polymerase III delta' subunit